jgi:NADH dehydrogenase
MADTLVKTGRLVTVFGGSGFVGRQVVRALARRGWRVRVATRRPDLAFHLQPLGRVGQIHAVQANVRYPASVAAALRDSEAVINLVGILDQFGAQRFETLHTFGARVVAKAAKEAGITHFVHMSALGAAPQSASVYAATKARGEAEVLAAFPEAVIIRPSIIFGADDHFFNRFAAMARIMPALPLIGGGTTKFQPVFVGDVAQTFALALEGKARPGTIYELGGPEIKSFRELMEFILKVTERKRLLVPIPFPIAGLMARGTEIARAVSCGLFSETFVITRDQVKLLQTDNVVSAQAIAENRTLSALGIVPESYETIVPTYLHRFRKTGQYASQRMA